LPPILAVSGVEKSFARGWPWRRRKNRVLQGISFSLEPGKLVGLVGENGSGKSVLLKIIVKSLEPDAGKSETSGRLGYCPQLPMLYEKLTCDETFDLFGHAYNLADDAVKSSSAKLYESLGFERFRGEQVEILSGGTRQKLNLAIALLHDPDLLLLDEPYSGFDWDTYQKFWGIADDLRKRGKTVVVVSHFLQERERFDQILDLRDGVLVGEEKPS
jgi:ABC-type multidrug transport system ATPase subunit